MTKDQEKKFYDALVLDLRALREVAKQFCTLSEIIVLSKKKKKKKYRATQARRHDELFEQAAVMSASFPPDDVWLLDHIEVVAQWTDKELNEEARKVTPDQALQSERKEIREATIRRLAGKPLYGKARSRQV